MWEGEGSETPTAFDTLIEIMLKWDADGKYDKEATDIVELGDEPEPPARLCNC